MSSDREHFFNVNNFRQILWREFEARKTKRKSYTTTAFARDLSLPASTLRGILSGRDGLSSVVAEKIANKLGFSSSETAFFISLVDSHHARAKLERDSAKKKVAKLQNKVKFQFLKDSELELMSEWYYAAIHQIISTGNFETQSAAKRLRLSVAEVKNAVDTLLKFGRIKKVEGAFVCSDEFVFAQKKTPTFAIRSFHKQLLSKTMECLDREPIEKRKNISTVFVLQKENLQEAREWLAKASQEFMEKFGESKGCGEIYAVGLHLTRLDEGEDL